MKYLYFTYPIYPNNKQKNLINKTFGCCRWMFNELLSRYINNYELYKKEKELNKDTKFTYKIENCSNIKNEYSISVSANNTTQTCHRCGYIKKGDNKLKLHDKVYHCPICGLVYDRDYNAAINIKNKGIRGIDVKEFKHYKSKSLIESCMYDNRYTQLINTIKSYNKIQKNKPIYCYKEYGDTRPFALANESSLEGSRKNSYIISHKRRRSKI